VTSPELSPPDQTFHHLTLLTRTLNTRLVLHPAMALDKSPAEKLNIGSLSITSQASNTTPSRPSPPELSRANKAVREYLLKNSTGFAAVDEIRERVSPAPNTILGSEPHTDPPYQGWSSPKGDKFYQQKCERVMNTSKQDERKFFNMYVQIADTMQTKTHAFTSRPPHPRAPPQQRPRGPPPAPRATDLGLRAPQSGEHVCDLAAPY